MAKAVVFCGTSRGDLRAFPTSAQRTAGFQIEKVQEGYDPDDWKPLSTVGPGVREIRIRDDAGAFRIVYVAKFSDAVYVLHCFQKKTQKTPQPELELARKRYRDLQKELKDDR